ncbi:hypothetical protein Tco_1183052 [Tanacetum coccineum]
MNHASLQYGANQGDTVTPYHILKPKFPGCPPIPHGYAVTRINSYGVTNLKSINRVLIFAFEISIPSVSIMAEPLPPDHKRIWIWIFEDKEDEWKGDDDWLMALVTPPRAASLTISETQPLPIDPIMLSGYQITTSNFYPWIPPTQPSTYKVGCPSSAVPEASHPVGRPLLVVAARVALHHREIGALCVRAHNMEDMQYHALSFVRKVDGVSDAQMADNIAIAELQPRMTVVEEGVQTSAEQGKLVTSKLDETKTQVLEMRDIVDNYPRGQVDTLREEMDELHGKRISALEQRPPGPPDGSQIMSPKRLKRRVVERLVKNHVAEAIAEYERTKTNSENARGSGGNTGNTRGVAALDDIEKCNNRFHELALMCPDLVTPKKNKIECYIRGLLERVKAIVTSSKPATLHDVINMARELTKQAIHAKATRIGESNKRKWEDHQRNNKNNRNNNTYHQQQNRRQEAAKAYVVSLAGGKVFLGNLPLCNRCKLHHLDQFLVKCRKCKRIGHQTKDYWSKTSAADTPPTADANA